MFSTAPNVKIQTSINLKLSKKSLVICDPKVNKITLGWPKVIEIKWLLLYYTISMFGRSDVPL